MPLTIYNLNLGIKKLIEENERLNIKTFYECFINNKILFNKKEGRF